MLSMSDVINSLKYEHEYNQFSKRFAGLHDVKKNSFFLWYTTNECAALNLFCRTISAPCTSCSKLRQMINNHSILTLWSFQGSWCWYCCFFVAKVSYHWASKAESEIHWHIQKVKEYSQVKSKFGFLVNAKKYFHLVRQVYATHVFGYIHE